MTVIRKCGKNLRVKPLWKLILILLICSVLGGCSQPDLSEPNQTQPPTEAATMQPTESVPTPTETKPPAEDTILEVSTISLADLQDSYVLLVSDETGSYLYRLDDTFKFSGRIECYRVAEITEDFLSGEGVDVISAVRNSVNLYDLRIFGNRFYYLHDQGMTEQLDEIVATWDGSSSWIIRTADMACVTTDNEMELEELMYLLYADRGTGIQHFGPPSP